MDTNELLREMHESLAKDLLGRIKRGCATPAELREARQFLKDNGIDAVPAKDTTLLKLTESMPDFDEDEGEDAA